MKLCLDDCPVDQLMKEIPQQRCLQCSYVCTIKSSLDLTHSSLLVRVFSFFLMMMLVFSFFVLKTFLLLYRYCTTNKKNDLDVRESKSNFIFNFFRNVQNIESATNCQAFPYEIVFVYSVEKKSWDVKSGCRCGLVEPVVDAFLENLIDGLTFSVC